MKEGYEKIYHTIEKEQWWFKTRRKYIVDYLQTFPKDIKILDIGCSSGILLNELKAEGFRESNLYGVDISKVAVENCRANGLPNCFEMDAQNIQLQEASFDVLIASDCLEHLEDDEKALLNWKKHLKQGGTLIVFVPAFMSLWSRHDEANMHFRRYSLPELKKKVQKADFDIQKESYWNMLLFFPTYIFRTISRNITKGTKSTTGDLLMPLKPINLLLILIVSVENLLLRKINLPVGVSAFCIAKTKK